MTETDPHIRARRRAEAKYKFYNHLTVYIVVNLFLIAINLLTSPQSYWFIWPLLGWGVAVAIQAARVFMLPDEDTMIERLTERELRKDQPRKG